MKRIVHENFCIYPLTTKSFYHGLTERKLPGITFYKHLTKQLQVFKNLSNSNVIRTHNHFVRKRTLNHLAKLACPVTLKRVPDMIITYR